MEDLLDIINFNSDGLVPVIVQDFYNKDVLMMAYADKEAVKKSLETGYAHYHSRSRDKLWMKGETSSHTQKIKKIFYDCDEDTLLIMVEQKGAACHTNHRSCFYREFFRGKTFETEPKIDKSFNGILYNIDLNDNIEENLYKLLLDRKKNLPENSYTAELFKKGINSILKKIGEEASETIIAMKDAKQDDIIYESADLLFHLIVALAYFEIPPSVIEDELKRRSKFSGKFEKETRKK